MPPLTSHWTALKYQKDPDSRVPVVDYGSNLLRSTDYGQVQCTRKPKLGQFMNKDSSMAVLKMSLQVGSSSVVPSCDIYLTNLSSRISARNKVTFFVFQAVESGITNNLLPALSTVVSAIDAFSIIGCTADQAMAISTAATNLNEATMAVVLALNNANCPFSDRDSAAILSDIWALSPNVQQALTDIITRQPRLVAAGVASSIQQDLVNLKASSDALGTAGINCLSPSVAPEAQIIQSATDAAFAAAIAAFD
ncbi:hypothetical protein C0993_005024 [Termitomyces sp. T159_Od127]|nr:hypothetical protein C0993_005024 [Termitomyces sp. T159_Od127]